MDYKFTLGQGECVCDWNGSTHSESSSYRWMNKMPFLSLYNRALSWSAGHMAAFPIAFIATVPPSWRTADIAHTVVRIPAGRRKSQCLRPNSLLLYPGPNPDCHFQRSPLWPRCPRHQPHLQFHKYFGLKRPARLRGAEMKVLAGNTRRLNVALVSVISSYTSI